MDERIEPGHEMYEKLVGEWKENKEPGQLDKGGVTWKVLKPDGYPVFVRVEVGLNEAYSDTSNFGGRR